MPPMPLLSYPTLLDIVCAELNPEGKAIVIKYK